MLKSYLRSLWIWTSSTVLILSWLPILALIRLFDFDPVRYNTGRWFRRLGALMVKVNPAWKVHVSGEPITDPRKPYVVVSNHQSFADIPIISVLPWEMKWLAKTALFRVPVVGWMLKMAGDIPVERGDKRKAAQAFLRARWYLEQKCSVMFFPEGTRSMDTRVQRFNEGAFQLALRQQLPILPLAVEGSSGCLPKHSFLFGEPRDILLHVFPPVETTGLSPEDSTALTERIRSMIVGQIALWRGCRVEDVDALQPVASNAQS